MNTQVTTDSLEKFSNHDTLVETSDENFDSDMDESTQIELKRGRELLKRILDEQSNVEASILLGRKQVLELNNDNFMASKENAAPTNKRVSTEVSIENLKIKGIQKSKRISEDLCVGLRTLTGVKALEVTESEEGGVRLLITIGECSFAMTLDSDKRICDIKILSGSSPLDLKKLLQDSRILPGPQDLRYAVFAVGASQHSSEAIKKHLADLRKCCIVKVLGPLRIELGLPNSITAVISVHECYPEVPSGVHVDSLWGLDETLKEKEFLRDLKAMTNAGCFRTVSGMFQFLTGIDGLGTQR